MHPRVEHLRYIYTFDATGGVVNTYALVKAIAPFTDFDNTKVKLYTSDDATKTFSFADTDVKMDKTSGSAIDKISTPAGLIGYELDADGYINTINTLAVVTTDDVVKLQSAKVLIVDGHYLKVASDAVVFGFDGTDTYSVGTVADIDKAVANLNVGANGVTVTYILNSDKEVAAMKVDSDYLANTSDNSYGVINTITSVMDGTDPVQKLVGFIGGSAFTKNTTDGAKITDLTIGVLGKIAINADGTITAVDSLATTVAAIDKNSGYVTLAAVVTATNTDRTVLTVSGSALYTVAANAVVYEAVLDSLGHLDYYKVASLTNIKHDYTVWLYDTKGSDADGIANVVIFANEDLK